MSSRFVLSAQLAITPPSTASIRSVVNQVNSQLQGIKAPNVFNSAQINKQSKSATQAIKQTTKAAQTLDSTFSSLRKRFSQRIFDAGLFSIANAGVVALTSAFTSAVRSGISFEKELIKISQVTKKTTEELGTLLSTISEVATTAGTSSAELVTVGRTLAQAGLSARDTEVALRAVADTDLAPTFENMTKTAEGAIAIFGQFGTSVEELGGELGSITALAANFAVESGDLIEAIKRGGSAFQTAGGSLEEYLALFTTVRSTTREGAAQIGTGLRTIFTRIQRPATIKYFEQLGVNLTDTEGKFIGAFEAVKRLSAAFGSLEQGDTQLIEVAQQLGGVRQVTRVLPLLQEFAKSEDALAVAMGGTNSVLEDREAALSTFAAKLNQLKESTLELGRTILEEGGVLKSLTDVFTQLAQAATATVKGIAVLNTVLGEGATGFIGLGAAIGVASVALVGFNAQTGVYIAIATTVLPLMAKWANSSDALNDKLVTLTATMAAMLGVAKALGGLSLFSAAGAFTGFSGLANGGTASLGTAAVGAAGGVGGSLLAQGLTGRSAKAQEDYDTALKNGTAELIGNAAALNQNAKDLDNAGMVIGGAVGGVAAVFLGPVAGALIGAATGVAFELLATVPAFQSFASGLRDVLASFTGGYVRSNELIRTTAEAQKIATTSIKNSTTALKDFTESLKDAEGAEKTSQELTDKFNKSFSGVGGQLDVLKNRRAAILDQNGDGNADRASGEVNKFSDGENRALQEIQQARTKAGEVLLEGFKTIAADTIRAGGDFSDAFARLSPELQKRVQEEFGSNFLRSLFKENVTKDGVTTEEDAEFIKNIRQAEVGKYREAIRDRIKSEIALTDATRKLLEVQDEAAKIIAQFGGPAFTTRQQEASLLKQANAGATGSSTLRSLDPAQLEKRGLALSKDLADVREQLLISDTGGEQTTRTKELKQQEKEILRLSKQTYDVTKKLIDIRKEELRVIDIKNKKEQEALNAAISGDFSKLFQQQQASGVIASAASGGGVSGFGQSAIAAAIRDLQSQRDAGVSQVFGQDISTLIKTIAGGGLFNLGINDPNAAGIAAGATPEQEALKANIRELASVLPAAAQGEQTAARDQVKAAKLQIRAAEENVLRSGGTLPTNKAIGGSIFRNRGTDTVPAMLTPGEFVVRRSAVQRGNNLNMLRAMNQGGDAKSVGGTVYANTGGQISSTGSSGMDYGYMSKAASAMHSAATAMSTMVEKLGQLNLNVTLAPTTHNVNITGTAALQAIGEKIEEKVIAKVGEKLVNFKATEGGRLEEQTAQSSLPSFT